MRPTELATETETGTRCPPPEATAEEMAMVQEVARPMLVERVERGKARGVQ